MARGYYKTPEEIEAEQMLHAEQYPDAAPSDSDPTQANRDAITRLMRRAPAVQSVMGPPSAPETFEMSPEMKRYGYNLFGMDRLAPSDEEVPSSVDEEPTEEAQPDRAPAALEAPEVEQPEAPAPQRQPAAQKIEAAPEVEQAPAMPEAEAQPTDIDKMIQQATEEEDRASLWKQSAKLRDAVMGAGSGTILKTDTSMYDEMAQRAQRPTKNMLLKQELENTQAKNDPNSQVSKLTRKSLQDLGMNMEGLEGISYAQLEKLYPSLTQALYVKLKAESDREQKVATNEAKDEIKQIKADEKEKANYFKTQTGIDRMISQMQKGKSFVGYEQAKQAKTLLEEASISTDPNVKVNNAASFMNYAKVAQGDDSVVRSEDMKVLAGSFGINSVKEMLGKIAGRAKGTPFSRGELDQMRKVVDTIIRVKKDNLRQQISPLKKRAQANNYDLSESIDPSLLEEIESEPEASSPAQKLEELDKKLKSNQARIEELRSRRGE
jgi:hypothetical protein